MSEKISKILILFYSRYGNTAEMAEEIAYGAKRGFQIRSVALRRIADDVPAEVISENPEWSKTVEDLTNRYPTSKVEDLVKEMPNYDAIIFGSPTRFGNMAAPMKALWDRTSELWMKGSLIDKLGAVFTGAAKFMGVKKQLLFQ